MRLIRYKRTIPPATSGEAMFVSPTQATDPSTSTPICLASKGSALNIRCLLLLQVRLRRKAQRLLRREREKSMLIIFLIVQNVQDKCA